jgi:hypothetical protein
MSQLKKVPCHHVDCPALGAVAVLAQQNSFGYALVGGAVRDAYHHRTATDHDIAVWGHGSRNDITAIQVALEELGYAEESYHDENPDYPEESGASDGRYECIIQYSHEKHPCVDILVFSSEFSQLSDVLDSFDYNLNQFAIRFDNTALSQRQTAYYGGDQLFVLKQLRSSKVTEERAHRMQAMACDYGWKVEREDVCQQLPLPQ